MYAFERYNHKISGLYVTYLQSQRKGGDAGAENVGEMVQEDESVSQ